MTIDKVKERTYKLLRWSQKYTATDMVYLARGGFWIAVGEIFSNTIALLSALAFANLLDPVIYGNYRYVLSIVSILNIFALPEMKTAIVQAVARGLEGSFYSGFKEKLRFGILASISAVILAGYYLLKGNHILPFPLLIAALFIPLLQASTVYDRFLMGRKLFSFQTKFAIITQIVTSGTLIATIVLTRNLLCLIAAYFISYTVCYYSLYLFTKKKFRPNKEEDPQTISYGKHMSIISVFGVITNELDKIMLFHFLGAAQLAIYSFASTPFQPIQTILKKLGLISMPKLTQRNIKEIKQTLPPKIIKLFAVIVPVVALYIFLAPWFYRTFLPQYTASIIYSQVFVASLLFSPKIFLAQTLTAHMKKKQLYFRSIFYSSSKIALLAILLPVYGIWGAISALIGAEIIDFSILALIFKRL